MKKVYLKTLKPEEIIKRLKDGEVVKHKRIIDRKEVIYRMIDNIIVIEDKRGATTIGGCLIIDKDDNYYFEEEGEQFEITEKGFYRTRDGRRAYVCDIDPDGGCTFVIDGMSKFIYHTTKQGRYSRKKECGIDLVDKWENEE